MLKFKVFQKYTSHYAKVAKQIDKSGLAAMKLSGAVIRKTAMRKIRRVTATASQRRKLAEAVASKDADKIAKIRAAIARRTQSVSKPGSPPYSHVPDRPYASLRDIRFAATNKSVLVGPAGGNKRVLVGSNRITVPEITEEGGTASISEIEIVKGGQSVWVPRRRGNKKPWQQARQRKVVYGARPFMGPALKESGPAITKLYAKVFGR